MQFELQPVLENELVRLQPLKETDFTALFEVASDPLIWEQHPEPDRFKSEVFQKYFDSAIESGGAFLVLAKGTDQIIGCTRYYNPDENDESVIIGYTFLSRACWGGRYNQAMKKLMMDHAFKFVKKIYFHIGEKNIRSQEAIKKIGAQYFGKKSDDGLIFVIEKQ